MCVCNLLKEELDKTIFFILFIIQYFIFMLIIYHWKNSRYFGQDTGT